MGSLVSLPYALAEAEQNFLIPSREQALIWGDLVPQLLLTATIPRWWNVTPGQLHWVALHMDYAETLLAEAAVNAGPEADRLGCAQPIRHAGPRGPGARVAGARPREGRARQRNAFRTVRDRAKMFCRPIKPILRSRSKFAGKPPSRRSS